MNIKKNFNKNKRRVWWILAGLVIAALLLSQLPPIRNRLEWRLQIVWTYVRGVVNPVKPLPTPLPTLSTPTAMPTETPTPAPTPTITATVVLSPTPTATPTPLPGQVQLPPPLIEYEEINACGPATLTMYLRYYGWQGTQKDISAIVKSVRTDRNVNVDELTYYVRNYAGWLNAEYRVGGNLDLLRTLLAQGLPVMIEGSFYLDQSYWPNDDRWAGHYLLLTGYDDATQIFTIQDSERGPDQKVPYATLQKDWQSFNYVYILVYPPEQQPFVQAILGENWDPDQNRRNALALAEQQTQSDPQNAFAWFNLGTNLVYFERYSEAATAYDQARTLGLPQRMLRYQFGPFIAYFNVVRNDDLLALTEYALQRTPNSEEALLWRGWALYRAGDKQAALAAFNEALQTRPDYADALYAIQFVNQN